MSSLLKEDSVWAKDLTDIDRDLLERSEAVARLQWERVAHELLRGKNRVHDRDIRCGEVRRDGEDEETGVREDTRVALGRRVRMGRRAE